MPLPTRTKVAIIGSGPAGYTAAIYAARANLEPVVFEGGGAAIEPFTIPGGQLMITTDVENYPGFPKGVEGPELMELFKAQAERFGTTVVTADVTAVDLGERPFRVVSTEGELAAETLIIATGASAKWLGIPSEEQVPEVRRVGLRDLRRRVVQGARPGRRRRRRHRDGGGDLPDPVRAQGHGRPPPRRVPRVEDHARPRAPQPARSSSSPNAVVDEILGELPRPGVTGVRLRDTRDDSTRELAGRRRVRRHRPRAELEAVQGPARHGRGRLHQDRRRARPRPRSRACSPAATSPTTSTARRSPRRAPAAWPPSTPSASSPTDLLPLPLARRGPG